MVTLTEKAVSEVKRIIAEMEGDQYLRVGVRGGGCAGFSYALNLDTETSDKDIIEEQNGIKIAIDKRSSLYLQDVSIDFHEDFMKRGFVFNNPNSRGKCGCGSSFSM